MSEFGLEEPERDDNGSQAEGSGNEVDTSTTDHHFEGEHSEKKATSGKVKRPSNLTSLIASKITELEKESTRDEEEEKEIARAVKAEHRKLSSLVSETDSEIDKVTLLQRKYTSLFQDMQRLEREHARQRSKSEKSVKEHNTSKLELNKAINMKQKLETLCRELQKENKRIKEDNKRQIVSNEQKRAELNSRFESTIFQIKTKMDEDSGIAGKRRVEDNELKDKFKSFLEQYELREKHFYNSARAKDLEILLNQARAERCRKAAEASEQRAKNLHAQVSTFSETESELRNQLNVYVEKFKQVEDTLNNSNDLFLNFRKEMETMTKKTKKLEKENALIRSKCDTANKNILDMAEERAKHRKEIESLKQKSTKLENLCRALQNERTKAKQTSAEQNHDLDGSARDGESHQGKKITTEAALDSDRAPMPAIEASNKSLDCSAEDDCSVTSFEIEQPHSVAPTSSSKSPDPVILGFLKVSDEEESLIREKRHEYGQNPHPDPDRDQDGYLAVSALEKEFIGAMRDAKLAQVKIQNSPEIQAPFSPQSHAAEMVGKFNLFSKVFGNSVSNSTLDGNPRERTFTPEEKRLYDEAAARLAAMTQKFVDREGGRLGEKSSDAHTRQLESFKRQMPPDKLKDFSTQYDQMLLACRSLVTSPDTMPQTYEALMTSMAILLSEDDLSDLKILYEKSRTTKR